MQINYFIIENKSSTPQKWTAEQQGAFNRTLNKNVTYIMEERKQLVIMLL